MQPDRCAHGVYLGDSCFSCPAGTAQILAQPTPEESGRPPIDAPMTEHRRWFADKLAKLGQHIYWRSEGSDSPGPRNADWNAEQAVKVRDELIDAYMDGNRAERQTLEFKSNEFTVVSDKDYSIFIEDYADRSMVDPPRYRLQIFHGQKRVLMLYGLEPANFDIDTRTIANINSEGP